MDALLLRADEVGKLLGLGRSKTYQLMQSGELPVVRIGRAVRVPRAALDEWIRQQANHHNTGSHNPK